MKYAKNSTLLFVLLTLFNVHARADLLDQALDRRLGHCTAEVDPNPQNPLGYVVKSFELPYPPARENTSIYSNPNSYSANVLGAWKCKGDQRSILNCILRHAVDEGACKRKGLFQLALEHKLGRCVINRGKYWDFIVAKDRRGEVTFNNCTYDNIMCHLDDTLGCGGAGHEHLQSACMLDRLIARGDCGRVWVSRR